MSIALQMGYHHEIKQTKLIVLSNSSILCVIFYIILIIIKLLHVYNKCYCYVY